MFSCESLPQPKTVLSVAASLTTSALLFKTITSDLIPTDYVKTLFKRISNQLIVVIDESDGLTPNQLFEAANTERIDVPTNSNARSDLRFFELSFHKKHKETVLKKYLPYILKKATEMKDEKKAVKLHTVDYHETDYWGSVVLNHPATFETMAMDPDKKAES
ncbi:hypothetical protein L2E82_10640 [Cichorium intybus]|uniref:Uncharacterized protein n=1 Tax=Cichorium intybus TaxID=13427 RepID=A0ACB9GC37_CICIN|nr:hypothetical protein L2E82_10640 [Cichorium intybus]